MICPHRLPTNGDLVKSDEMVHHRRECRLADVSNYIIHKVFACIPGSVQTLRRGAIIHGKLVVAQRGRSGSCGQILSLSASYDHSLVTLPIWALAQL